MRKFNPTLWTLATALFLPIGATGCKDSNSSNAGADPTPDGKADGFGEFWGDLTGARRLHETLFSTYFPLLDQDPGTLDGRSAEIVRLQLEQRDLMWQEILDDPSVAFDFYSAGLSFKNMPSFTLQPFMEVWDVDVEQGIASGLVDPNLGDAGIRLKLRAIEAERLDAFIDRSGEINFSELSREQRYEFLHLLGTSPLGNRRKIAKDLKAFYSLRIYDSRAGDLFSNADDLVDHKGYRDRTRPDIDRFLQQQEPLYQETCLEFDFNEILYRGQDRGGPAHCAETSEIEYLIIGAGAAGSVMAHELRQTGKAVVVIEKAPFTFPGAMQTKNYDALLDLAGRRTTDDGAVVMLNGSAVGGGTAVNWDLSFPPTIPFVQERLRAWEAHGLIESFGAGTPWTWAPENVARAAEWVNARTFTRPATEDEINENNMVLADGAIALREARGGSHSEDDPAYSKYMLNARRAEEVDSRWDIKISATEAFLRPAMLAEQNAVQLIPQAEVARIRWEGYDTEIAEGAEVEFQPDWNVPGVISNAELNGFEITPGRQVTIHAKNIIVAAGALGTPLVLAASDLDRRLPHVGEGILGHIFVPMLGLFDHEVASLGGTTESSVFVSDYMLSHNFVIESSSITPGWMSTAFSLLSPEQTAKYVNHYRNAAIFGTILLDNSHVGEPDWSNRVVRKYDGEPSYEYGVIDRDRDNFAFGVAEAVRMFLLAGAREVVVPTNEAVLVDCGDPNNAHTAQCVNGDVQCQVTLDNPWDLPTFTSFEQAECLERYLQFVPNRTNLANFHLQGSCKLGPDPSNSVVGHDHRVHGTQNVYVMDSSVFPTTVGANPMQSIYSLSKLVAERIAGRVLSQ